MREEMQQGAKDTKISMKARGAKKLASSSMHDERMPELQERAPSKHNTASESVRGNKRKRIRESWKIMILMIVTNGLNSQQGSMP